MENDLISRNAMFDAMRDAEFQTFVPLDEVDEVIANVPSIEAEPVRHGKWVRLDNTFTRWKCSECGAIESYSGYAYCHCGAKMDAKEDDHA